MRWQEWAELLGADVVDAALHVDRAAVDLADLVTFGTYREDMPGGVRWMRGLPAPRLAGLLQTLNGETRSALMEAWAQEDEGHERH